MSDGFVFPPSEHENLPIEPEHENLPIEPEHDESNTNSLEKESRCAGNNDDDWCHVSPEEIDGVSNENLADNSDLPTASEATVPDSHPTEINAKREKDHTTCKADHTCERWWKKKTTYLFHHIKGVTTLCSVVAAGAVVGFVVMGQRWQQDHWHLHQFKFSVSGEVCHLSFIWRSFTGSVIYISVTCISCMFVIYLVILIDKAKIYSPSIVK